MRSQGRPRRGALGLEARSTLGNEPGEPPLLSFLKKQKQQQEHGNGEDDGRGPWRRGRREPDGTGGSSRPASVPGNGGGQRSSGAGHSHPWRRRWDLARQLKQRRSQTGDAAEGLGGLRWGGAATWSQERGRGRGARGGSDGYRREKTSSGGCGCRGGSSVLLTQRMAALLVDEEDRRHDGTCGWRRDEVGEALDLPDLAAAGAKAAQGAGARC